VKLLSAGEQRSKALVGFGFGTGGIVLFVGVFVLFCFPSVWVLSSVWHCLALEASACSNKVFFFGGAPSVVGWTSGRVLQQLLHQMETRNELGPYMHHQEE
jgi:hypothetical protein